MGKDVTTGYCSLAAFCSAQQAERPFIRRNQLSDLHGMSAEWYRKPVSGRFTFDKCQQPSLMDIGGRSVRAGLKCLAITPKLKL